MKSERSIEISTDVLINYAYGLLAPAVAVQVKKALEEEEILRWQYEGIVTLMEKHPDEDPGELLEQMANRVGKNIAAAAVHKQERPKSFSRRWLLAAAVIIALAGIGTFITMQKKNDSAAQLATAMIKNSAASPYSNATRGSITPIDSAADLWKEAFVQNDFNKVIAALETKTRLTSEEQFFLALSYLKQSSPQPEKAALLLKQLTAVNNEFAPDAWLYLALAQTLENKNKEAAESLSHVEQNDQVKELTERLRR